jgi:hypothetical protein
MSQKAAKLDAYSRYISPWDFEVEVGGRTYATRPMTLGDIAKIEGFEKNPPGVMGQIVAFAQSLFAGDDKPDVSQWPAEYLPVLLGEVGRYWSDRAKKNNDAIKRAMVAASPGEASGS